jgi:glutathione S-transferase
MRRLVTIPLSHFCEKARWALDLAGVPYREDGWPPALHRIALMRYRAHTAPVLIVGDGTVLRESSEIVRHADEVAGLGLYGDTPAQRAEIDALTARFDDTLGPNTRLGVYARTIDDPPTFSAIAGVGLEGRRKAAFDRLRPAIGAVIRRYFRIDDATREKADAAVAEELAFADERRAGGPYLVGDRFSAADLTFAALSAPLVFPPQYGVALPALDEMPAPIQAECARWRTTPSGTVVLDLYARHRHPQPAAAGGAAA